MIATEKYSCLEKKPTSVTAEELNTILQFT